MVSLILENMPIITFGKIEQDAYLGFSMGWIGKSSSGRVRCPAAF